MAFFSVVLTTYNRAELLPRALASVLGQTFGDFELVVVDDGSTDSTPTVVSTFGDPRVRYLRQENAGLSAARNAGITGSSGPWVVFLDDDDEVEATWLEHFCGEARVGECGVVCCGVTVIRPSGSIERVELPHPLGPVFDNSVGLFLAGTFAVRRDLLVEAGGYAAGLSCSHQTELAMRLLPACAAAGAQVSHVDMPLLRMHRERPAGRPRNDPARLLAGTAYILDHHRSRLSRSPAGLADYLSVAGVSAARMGDYGKARRYLWEALRADPRAAKRYGRLVLAVAGRVGARVWRARVGAATAG